MNNENKRGRKPRELNCDNIFSIRLRSLIKETDSKQQDIADYIGVSRQTLNKWVNGKNAPDIFSAAKLADYFNSSIDYLLGRTDAKYVNEDIQMVCKVTGLSDHDILKIQRLSKLYKSVLSNLISALDMEIKGVNKNGDF